MLPGSRPSNTLSPGNEIQANILGVSDDIVWLDIGMEHLGVMSVPESLIARGQRLRVHLVGSDLDGLYLVAQTLPQIDDPWEFLATAFQGKKLLSGRVTGFVRGGFSVDVGTLAFLPGSRSGARGGAEIGELIGQNILCRVVELSYPDRNVVLDRRSILDAADWWEEQVALQGLKQGSIVSGTVCTLKDFGAFVDLGGVDGLLHVSDISWSHIERPSDVLKIGQTIEVLIENVDTSSRRVALSMKALSPNPWSAIATKYKPGDRVRGRVTSVTDFGAFVEIESGVEGLVHESDLSWSRKSGKPRDIVRPGQVIEVVVLSTDASARRIALGKKQVTEDPWGDIENRFPVGTIVTGQITSLTSFGAFVAIAEDIEGLLHVSDISDTYINQPSDVLSQGDTVRTVVLEADSNKRRIRLGMRDVIQTAPALEPSPIELSTRAESTAVADFSEYSRSVFVNWPANGAFGLLGDAILFTLVAADLVPRVIEAEYSPTDLLKAVRESQFGIHEASRLFELGVFWGCREYGSDLHRMKESLVLGADHSRADLGATTGCHAADPATTISLVVNWLVEVKGLDAAALQKSWELYQEFQEALPGLLRIGQLSREKITRIAFIALARDWVTPKRREIGCAVGARVDRELTSFDSKHTRI